MDYHEKRDIRFFAPISNKVPVTRRQIRESSSSPILNLIALYTSNAKNNVQRSPRQGIIIAADTVYCVRIQL